ncbi:MAG: T9SS type A sorting domain-containing protein [Bacteroidia bacterium]|nr:T9SS type A sorting domain-containing protein [Bacteroidia bacterium]
MKYITLLLISFSFAFGQTLDYGKSNFNQWGDTGQIITPMLQIKNISSNNIQIFVTRIEKNLPVNWTVCFCYIVCNPPSLDTLRIDMIPGETASIGNGFHADSIRGTGSVKLAVEVIGGSQKDTLVFTASSLASDIQSLNYPSSTKAFPNPCNNELIITNANGLTFYVYNAVGELIDQFECEKNLFKLNTSMYQTGNYILKFNNEKGNSFYQKLIIQH